MHRLLRSITLTTVVISCLSAHAAEEFSKIVEAIEAKLPVATKQAELLTTMLNDEAHLTKLQQDIDAMLKGEKQNAENTYLYKAFKDKEAAFESSAIPGEIVLEHASKVTRVQPLHPGLTFTLCFGEGPNGGRGFLRQDKTFFENSDNIATLVTLCQKILEIQKPVLKLALEKLQFGEKAVFDNTKLISTSDVPKNVYAFLLPVQIELGMAKKINLIIKNQAPWSDYPKDYKVLVKSLMEYLQALGYKTTAPIPKDKDFASIAQKIGEDLAEEANLDNL